MAADEPHEATLVGGICGGQTQPIVPLLRDDLDLTLIVWADGACHYYARISRDLAIAVNRPTDDMEPWEAKQHDRH